MTVQPQRLGWMALAALVALAPDAGAQVDVRLRLEPGRTYRLETETTQRIERRIAGRERMTEQTVGLGQSFEVLEVDLAGDHRLEVTFVSIRMRQQGPGLSYDYDSRESGRRAPLPPPLRGVPLLIGRSFEAVVGPRGEVRGVAGMDALLQQVAAEIDLPTDRMRQQAALMLYKFFNDEAMAGSLERAMAFYSDGPVAVGSTWERTGDVHDGFPLAAQTRYRLAERAGGRLRIDVETALEPLPDPTVQLEGNPIQFELRGRQVGRIVLAERSGWPIEGELEHELDGQMIVRDGQRGRTIMRTPLSVQTTTTLRSAE